MALVVIALLALVALVALGLVVIALLGLCKVGPTTSKALQPPEGPGAPFVRYGQEPQVTLLVSIGNGLDIVSKATPSTRTTASSIEPAWAYVRLREAVPARAYVRLQEAALNVLLFTNMLMENLDVEMVHEEAEKLAHNDNIKCAAAIKLRPRMQCAVSYCPSRASRYIRLNPPLPMLIRMDESNQAP